MFHIELDQGWSAEFTGVEGVSLIDPAGKRVLPTARMPRGIKALLKNWAAEWQNALDRAAQAFRLGGLAGGLWYPLPQVLGFATAPLPPRQAMLVKAHSHVLSTLILSMRLASGERILVRWNEGEFVDVEGNAVAFDETTARSCVLAKHDYMATPVRAAWRAHLEDWKIIQFVNQLDLLPP